jgi:hypothetical protein
VVWFVTVLGAVYSPLEVIVPTSVFPPEGWLNCQLTAELEAFSTRALNCLFMPGKSCAEVGMTVTVTGAGGAGPEPTAPQEVQIKQSREEAIRRMRENSRNRPSRGAGNAPRGRHSPGYKCNGLGIGSAYLHEFLESKAKATTTKKKRQ